MSICTVSKSVWNMDTRIRELVPQFTGIFVGWYQWAEADGAGGYSAEPVGIVVQADGSVSTHGVDCIKFAEGSVA